MKTNLKLYGISRLIYESLAKIAPEVVDGSQFIDCRVMQLLEESLRQKMVVRKDGSCRLVIELALCRAMQEVKEELDNKFKLNRAVWPVIKNKTLSPEISR